MARCEYGGGYDVMPRGADLGVCIEESGRRVDVAGDGGRAVGCGRVRRVDGVGHGARRAGGGEQGGCMSAVTSWEALVGSTKHGPTMASPVGCASAPGQREGACAVRARPAVPLPAAPIAHSSFLDLAQLTACPATFSTALIRTLHPATCPPAHGWRTVASHPDTYTAKSR